MIVIIHYNEIGLKGRNLPFFEKKLLNMIKHNFNKRNIEFSKLICKDKRITCECETNEDDIKNSLKHVFGICYFSFATRIKLKKENIFTLAKELMKRYKKDGEKEVAFFTKRQNKKFELNTPELHKILGSIANDIDLHVNYKCENKIFTEISFNEAFMYTEKFKGLDGMPVASSGKVLCLLSGGIDSPVSAWLTMKRGCSVDFLHAHTFENNKKVMQTKMNRIINRLNDFQLNSRIYLLPYSLFQIMTSGKINAGYEVLIFKHYLLKIAEHIALEQGYDAIITGDSIAQVASQTLENIRATSHDVKIPILRPLITYDKLEIMNLAKKIGTYKLSIEKYKDCCSIVAKKPKTRVKLNDFLKVLTSINLNKLIADSIKHIDSLVVETVLKKES